MFGRFDTMLAYDGRTDGQTSCDNVVCAMHTRRTVKIRLISIKNIKAIKIVFSSLIDSGKLSP